MLYGNGLLTRQEFDLLNRNFRLRTEIVHGLVAPAIDPALVQGIVAVIRRLLTGKPGAQTAEG